MKAGKSLVDLAKELEFIRKEAKDFIVPVEKLRMDVIDMVEENKENDDDAPDMSTAVLSFPTVRENSSTAYRINKHTHGQIAAYTDIPKSYYERILKESPELLAENVNHGLSRVNEERLYKGETRMVRTVSGKARAFLSSKYRRLDSYDLLDTVLPLLLENEFKVESAEYTEQRLYIQAVTPKVETEVKVGDTVRFGLTISSSDVGAGSLKVEPLVYRLVCLNGMIMDTALRKFHIGRDQADQEVYEMLTDDTKNMTDKAFWATVRDVVLASMKPKVFEASVNRLRAAADMPIKNFDIPEVVELATKAIGITGEETKNSIVAYLANGADGAGLNLWGLVNGVTYAAQQKHVNYDDSVDMQRQATKLLELPSRQLNRILEKTL